MSSVESKVLDACRSMDGAESIARGVKITAATKAAKKLIAENEGLKESISVETRMLELLANQLVTAKVRWPVLVNAHGMPNRAEDVWLVWASHEVTDHA